MLLMPLLIGGGGWRGKFGIWVVGMDEQWGKTYRVSCCELLLGANDASAALSGIQSGLSSNNSLSGNTTSTGLAANLSNGIPIVHCD
jgi:hypothetical protein